MMRFFLAGLSFTFAVLMGWRTWKNDRAMKARIDAVKAYSEAIDRGEFDER